MAHEGETLKKGIKGKTLFSFLIMVVLMGIFIPWLIKGCGQDRATTASQTNSAGDDDDEAGPEPKRSRVIWVGKANQPTSRKIELTGDWQAIEVYPNNEGTIIPTKDSQVLIWPADKEEEKAVTLKWQDIQDGKQVTLGAFASFKIKGKQGEVATIRTSPAR